MQSLSRIAPAALLLGLIACQAAPRPPTAESDDWSTPEKLGAADTNAIQSVAVAGGPKGSLAVAWIEAGQVRALYRQPSSWTTLGGGPANAGQSAAGELATAIDAGFQTTVLWTEKDSGVIHGATAANAGWMAEDLRSGNARPARQPVLAALRDSGLVAAWLEGAGVAVLKRSDSGWQVLSEQPLRLDPAGKPVAVDVTVDTQNRPVVAWVEDTPGGRRMAIRRWEANSWAELPVPGGVDTGTHVVQIRAGQVERLFLLFDAQTGSQPLYAWAGNKWSALGKPKGYGLDPKLAINPFQLISVGWVAPDGIGVARWIDDGGWQGFGSNLGGAAVSNSVSARLAYAADGTLLLAWHQTSGDRQEGFYRLRAPVAP